MVDRLISSMVLKTMTEKVDPGTIPAGFLKVISFKYQFPLIKRYHNDISKIKPCPFLILFARNPNIIQAQMRVPQLWQFYRYQTNTTRLFR
jgi:hypothetical protein